MCKIKSKSFRKAQVNNTAALQVISTRSNWLNEKEINSSKLSIQRHALKITAQKMLVKQDLEASSNIYQEIDEIDRNLS